jgi:NodT family efflux transporter outer membrane factor (OMF) lipoprotein
VLLGGAAALVVVLLSACVLPPKDDPRETSVDAQKLGLSTTPAPQAQDGWWQAYGDAQLNQIIEESLATNPTLEMALARVREAQSQADSAHAKLLPSSSLDADEVRMRASDTSIFPPPYGGETLWIGQTAATLSWDIDFWGKQRDLIREAREQTAAAALDAAGARLAVAGALAQAYVDLYRNYALADIAQDSVDQRNHIRDLTRQRVQAGLDTNVELRQADTSVPLARVQLAQAQAAQALAVHQLAALSGHGADAYAGIARPQLKLDAALPLPDTLPADLLGRRPDVLAARARVEMAIAGRAAAKAEFYPDVSLTGFAGFQSIGLADLARAASRTYGIGPALSLPLFDAGKLKANYRGSTAELDEAIASYNETVLGAVRQVADQLSNLQALHSEIAEQHESLNAAEAAYHLAEERYAAGLSGYLSVLTADTQVLSARRGMVDLAASQAITRVTLLLALGGSFKPDPSLVAAISPDAPPAQNPSPNSAEKSSENSHE